MMMRRRRMRTRRRYIDINIDSDIDIIRLVETYFLVRTHVSCVFTIKTFEISQIEVASRKPIEMGQSRNYIYRYLQIVTDIYRYLQISTVIHLA